MENNMTGRREKGAMKLMEALSGVDEEMLEACEAETKRLDERKKSPFFADPKIIRLTGLAAACLAFIVVGLGVWNVTLGPGGRKYNAKSEAVMAPAYAESAEEEIEYVMEEAEEIVCDEEAAEIAAPEPAAPAEDSKESLGLEKEVSNDAGEGTAEGLACGNTSELIDRNARPYTFAEAREIVPLGSYLPKQLPKGWGSSSVLYAEGTADRTAKMQAVFGDGNMTVTYRICEVLQGEITADGRIEAADCNVYTADELDYSAVEKELASGNAFCILYPDNVLVKIKSDAPAKDVWELLTQNK